MMMTNEQKRVRIAVHLGTLYAYYCSGCRECVKESEVVERNPVLYHTKCGSIVHRDSPNYPESLTTIQAAVAGQDVEFRDAFDEALEARAKNGDAHLCDLIAADWCDCFIAVMEGMEGKEK